MLQSELKLYNTESRQMEQVTALDGKVIRMYTCGPTVYNFAHIGNFRTYVFEDLLRRVLRFLGYEVKQVMNLTDVDDKTIKGALEKGVSLAEFTAPYIKAFFEDLETLKIEKVEHYPAATEYVPEMIALIEGLLEKGVAYRGQDQSIYFSIDRFPSYGRLSHLHLQDLKAGASQRVAGDEYDKEHVSDFVLWKAHDPARDGQIYWQSPFGPGRPGWHIECSAMAMKLLGPSIDIHVGGVDNIFPHHENEIAQCEAYSCRHFVRHWLHAEHLLVDHKKMSKSLGNFYTLRDLLAKGYLGDQVRYLLLQTHYRTQLNFTFDGLDAAAASLQRFSDLIYRLREIRRKKMIKALDVILDMALPNYLEKKSIQERILFDLNQEKGWDILDSTVLAPILQRSLLKVPDAKGTLDSILTVWKDAKPSFDFAGILEKNLKDFPEREKMVQRILKEVSDVNDREILDPSFLKPILQRALKAGDAPPAVADSILHTMRENKSHGLVFPIIQKTMATFKAHLANDLNISAALAALFDLLREVNVLCDQDRVGISEAEDLLDFLTKINEVLGVLPLQPVEEPIPVELIDALNARNCARVEKNWKVADACRDVIHRAGYVIEDTADGSRLKKLRKS